MPRWPTRPQTARRWHFSREHERHTLSSSEGEPPRGEESHAKCPLLADFKAVQTGNIWCTSQSLFQQSMELPDLILDMNRVFTEGTPDSSELKFLTHIQ